MTTAEKLAEVTAQIRKDIPRLMELREGCYVMDKITECVYRVYKVTDKIYKLCGVTNDDNWDINKKYFDSSVKIIGHDIMLNDVLEWLGKVLKEATEYRIGYTNIGKFGVKYREMLGVMDLSKPLLKDQSEYFIKFLYEFKNEHFRI